MASGNENKDFNLPVITINESNDQKPQLKSSRKDKSRASSQFRRTSHAQLLKELGSLLPFPDKVVQQIDYNSILRLVICYFQMKSLAIQEGNTSKTTSPTSKTGTMPLGMMQDLMTEALDGFVLVLLGDGTIVYLSDNIHKYLGLSQSEYIGTNIFDMILHEDHRDVKYALQNSEANLASCPQDGAPCSFFCRMKCPKFKMAVSTPISPGFKLMYVSGHFKMDCKNPRMVAVVRPVSPPSILEIRMEGNMFVTHHQLDMRCTFFDGRLHHLLGYTSTDVVDRLAFDFHHHEDLESLRGSHLSLLHKGEVISGYYRLLNKHGQFLWCQTRAHMMFHSRSNKPNYIVCMTFVINKKDGDASLAQRTIEAAKVVDIKEDPAADMPVNSHSYDPFPVTSGEWAGKNPFAEDQTLTISFPQQKEPISAVTSQEFSCSIKSLESPKSYTANPSPHLCDRLSPINQNNTIISPVSKHSVSSLESGYETSLSTPPNSVSMRSTGTPSPVFHHDPIPEVVSVLIPTQTIGNAYFKQQPQINFAQHTDQQFQSSLQSSKRYQTPITNLTVKPTVYLNSHVKQDPFTMSQCTGSKHSHQPVQKSTVSNTSQELSRNSLSTLSMEVLTPSFDDNIPPIAPLKELKTEDLDILELPASSHSVPQILQSTQWLQNRPNGGQSSIPVNYNTPGNAQGNPIFNTLQQQQHRQQQHRQQQWQLRTGIQSHCTI